MNNSPPWTASRQASTLKRILWRIYLVLKWLIIIKIIVFLLAVFGKYASGEERPRREYRLYDQQSRNKGMIRETDPNIYQMYDQKSRRTGTIYVRPDGHIDMFAPDGKRIGPRIVPSYPNHPNRRTP